ncbi:hypothetical protein BJ322DRAFT_712789 [Thelephora terrestris]|uniref:Myb/SANT-like domain-containing protein n=1 Tax=Thelephora terrestris TaxID=56493 RepID=A0A9P6HHD8_9AGAM|nr:hypothetical protein BJ322DRAFT_712789 [Thelephora terrestris]
MDSPETFTMGPHRCHWSAQDDRILVETLLIQKAAGNKAQSGWKSVVWGVVAAELQKVAADGQAEKTASKCNDHYCNLKSDFMLIKKLRNMTGFGWDDERNLVVAADDQWDELAKENPHAKKWRTTPFPIYDEMFSLVDGIVATGAGAFLAGTPPPPGPSQSTIHNEHSIEWTESSQSTESETPPHTPSDLKTAGKKAANKVNLAQPETKKRKRSITPEQSRLRKYYRQEQQYQDQTVRLITGMTQAVHELCSSLQPTQDPQQTPQQRRAAATKLMEADGDFEGPECIPVLRLFTSSIDVADTYLAIGTKAVRTAYIEDCLHNPS